MKIGVFGGTFDPIHNGHTEIIRETGKIFDRVIVLPAYRSPFKDAEAANPDLRLKMCRAETADMPFAVVSDYEINIGAPVYTADTLAHFAKEYGEGLALIAGSDCLYTLAEWYAPERLARVPIYIFKRAGYTERIECKRKEFIDRFGGRIEIIDYTPEDISSSEIKVAAAFGSLEGLTGGETEKIIRENNLYCGYKKFAEGLPRYGLSQKRLEHTKNTALTAVRLAKIHGLDTEKAAVAALLHDAGKNFRLEAARASGYNIGEAADEMPESCVHAEISVAIASRDFGITDKEILSAIRSHVTGRPAMTKLDEVIFIADYIEPGRHFQGVDEVREVSASSLTAAMRLILSQTMRHLEERCRAIDKRTLRTLEYYQSKEK